ncbi:MAG: LysR family transcriptional regulator [Ruminiclostridium sp.]|nr:LysR family transcriptional regulator [Ruminiclostridium sp.]
MNITYMRYAAEIARQGSFGKASASLHVAQPNLSRAIKDLENDIGIEIFERTVTGVKLTPEGEEFIARSQKILDRLDSLENMYKLGKDEPYRLSVCAPESSNALCAISQFSQRLENEKYEIVYRNGNAGDTMRYVSSGKYKFGIVRNNSEYNDTYNLYYSKLGLTYETLSEYEDMLTVSRSSPLAQCPEITEEILNCYTEIILEEQNNLSEIVYGLKDKPRSAQNGRHIRVFEHASRVIILSHDINTYLWLEPLSKHILDSYGLIQIRCPVNAKYHRDVLLYRKDSAFSGNDRLFIDEVHRSYNHQE